MVWSPPLLLNKEVSECVSIPREGSPNKLAKADRPVNCRTPVVTSAQVEVFKPGDGGPVPILQDPLMDPE
jgi:hypothetical protein